MHVKCVNKRKISTQTKTIFPRIECINFRESHSNISKNILMITWDMNRILTSSGISWGDCAAAYQSTSMNEFFVYFAL